MRIRQNHKNSRELITKKAEFEKRKFGPAKKHFLASREAIWRTIVGRGTGRFLFKGKIPFFSSFLKKWEFLRDFVQKPSKSFNFWVAQARKLGCDRFILRFFVANFKGWNHQNSSESTRIHENSTESTRIHENSTESTRTHQNPWELSILIWDQQIPKITDTNADFGPNR